jgi:hypothetical protein
LTQMRFFIFSAVKASPHLVCRVSGRLTKGIQLSLGAAASQTPGGVMRVQSRFECELRR